MNQLTFSTVIEYTPEENIQRVKDTASETQRILAQVRRIAEDLYTVAAREKTTIHSPTDIFNLVGCALGIEQQEALVVISLDTRNNVLGIDTIYRGSINSSQVRICELLRAAILHNAAALVVVHNHPSGDPTPSPDDISVTRAIVQAGKIMDLDVLDHLVIGAGRFVSLKERGLGFN